jgi:TRAP-type C4-dicarboxylate transport system permease small subunit
LDVLLVGRLVHALAKYVALAGGVVLVVVAAVTVFSVVGRALIPLGLSAVPGDYELVEAGMAFAIFAFLPWCQLMRGHAVVGILTDKLPARYNAISELVVELLMLAVAVFLAWRHWAGLLDKFGYMETTFVLRMPLWWSYAGGMLGAATMIVVAVYCLVRAATNAASRNPVAPTSEMVE